MTTRELYAMPRVWLYLRVLYFQISTFVKAHYRKRGKGISGYVVCISSVCLYGVAILCASLFMSKRARLALSGYAWIRFVDESIDGGETLPVDYSHRRYAEQKGELVKSIDSLDVSSTIALPEDVLLIHLLKGADSLSFDIRSGIKRLWELFIQDVEQRQHGLLMRRELEVFAIEQDRCCLGLLATVTGGDRAKTDDLAQHLRGIWTRTDWLTDLPEEMCRGIVNIPKEDIEVYGLDLADLVSSTSWDDLARNSAFVAWYNDTVLAMATEWAHARTELYRFKSVIIPKKGACRVLQWIPVHYFQQNVSACLRRLVGLRG